ncbi:unnamed protein product [Diplocarpon coronariae]
MPLATQLAEENPARAQIIPLFTYLTLRYILAAQVATQHNEVFAPGPGDRASPRSLQQFIIT